MLAAKNKLAIWFLGLTILTIVGSSAILSYCQMEMSSALIGLGGVAIGALGNLFNKN